MSEARPIHADFEALLKYKPQNVVDLFCDLRDCILEMYPDCNELLYHTHALTAVFSVSDKLLDAFCMIPVYTNHLNLGFNKGTLLQDTHGLLTGTGRLIRHIDVRSNDDYCNREVVDLIAEAVAFALADVDKDKLCQGKTISKIKQA